VLSSIQLRDKPGFTADKVHVEWANGMLPSEFETSQSTISQMAPEESLGICLVLSQLPGFVLHVFP
jgi:hypothetical protein